MKLIIAGSRTFFDELAMDLFIAEHIPTDEITEVVTGCACGADSLGIEWGNAHGIAVKVFFADWKEHGRAAGPIRNKQMAEYGDVLCAFWDGASRGTANMIQNMKNLNKPIHIYKF